MIKMLVDIREHAILAQDIFPVISYLSNNAVMIMSPQEKIPVAVYPDQYVAWSDSESRMNIIGQNGNNGEHYDAVNNPEHYTQQKVECIDVAENMSFCLGNALKYIWRCEHKGKKVEDLKKAIWYLEREIKRVEL